MRTHAQNNAETRKCRPAHLEAAAKTTLLVGFDSAWTPTKAGALVAVLRSEGGVCHELGPPRVLDYPQAEAAILKWQAEQEPTVTIILIDQPTIVENATGQRPVENIVASVVSRRRGAMQPASKSRKEMFGELAPIWPFLRRFGGAADPLKPFEETRVFETYPVLAIISLGWTLADSRPAGRLPKYNPKGKTFSEPDWQHVCTQASCAFCERGLVEIVRWIDEAARRTSPRKCDQDGLDACLCLLVALYLAEQKDCLLVGDIQTGYIVAPYDAGLYEELGARCKKTCRAASDWVRKFRLPNGPR
jgi:predicted RNase H-like nuclease